jgi:hypothetical protein
VWLSCITTSVSNPHTLPRVVRVWIPDEKDSVIHGCGSGSSVDSHINSWSNPATGWASTDFASLMRLASGLSDS